jgi:hypothetical protein
LTGIFEKVDTNAYEGNVFNSRLDAVLTLDETDPRTGQIYKQKGAEFTIESYPA